MLSAAGLTLSSAGCISSDAYSQLERENVALRERVDAQAADLAARDERIEALDDQVNVLQDLGPERLEKLFRPVRVEFASRSGGYDLDGTPGDDGVVVYLRPIDSDGHSVKAAGAIRVQLFDLANPEGRHEIALYAFSVDEARKKWYGRLATGHYTIKCPWPPDRLPDHRDITVRAEFTDYLTGTVLTCQDHFAVRFPPEPTE